MESLAHGIMMMALITTAIGGGVGCGVGWGVSKMSRLSKGWSIAIGGVAGLTLGFFTLPMISWLGYNLFG